MSYYRELQLIENGQCPCCSRDLEMGEDGQYLCKSCDISVAIPEKPTFNRRRAWVSMVLFCFAVWLILGLGVFMSKANAMQATGFLQGQFNQGGDNICVYDAMGHTLYQNVGINICPITIVADI